MSDKKSVTVNIYGNEYSLKGDADPSYISELSKYVDGKMSEVGRTSSASATKVAILAAMNIADEYHRAEKSRIEAQKLLEVAERNLLDMRRASEGSLKHSLELKQTIDKTSDDAVEARKNLDSARQETNLLRADGEKASQEAASARQEVEKAKQELQTARAEINSLREKSQKALADAEETRKKAGLSQNNNQNALQSLEKSKQELQAARTEINSLREKSKKALIDLDETLNKNNSLVQDLKNTQQEAVQAAQQIVASQKEAREEREKADAALLESAQAKQDLETAREERDSALREVKEKSAATDEDLDKLIQEAQKDIDAARKDASDKIRIKDEELNRIRRAANETGEASEKRIQALTEELSQVRQDLDSSSRKTEALQRQVTGHSQSDTQIQQVEKSCQTQLEASSAEIKSLKAQLTELETIASSPVDLQKINDLENTIESSRKESESLRLELSKVAGDLKTSKVELKLLQEKPVTTAVEPQLSLLPHPDRMEALLSRIDSVLEVR
jgi:cell division protein ZapA